uniref:Cms1 ribosomal small subunit homolog n=1 Tax=Cyprinus carpio TaxID=7962 RepID=A0A8C1XLY2_CYPCA
ETGDKESNKNKKGKNYNSHVDVLTSSEPVPGSPADLLSLLKSHHSQTRSVIEQEELTLSKSCFLSCNDLTHSSSCYLKEGEMPFYALRYFEKVDPVSGVLIICGSALRTIDLIKQLIVFKGQAKVLKLFVKHIKVDCCDKVIGLRYLVLDWNYRD